MVIGGLVDAPTTTIAINIRDEDPVMEVFLGKVGKEAGSSADQARMRIVEDSSNAKINAYV